jgi:hypothetical protein
MKLDLAFALIDIENHPNREWYRAAAGMMLESARHAFKDHDLRIVQLTDKSTPVCEGVNEAYAPAEKAEWKTFIQYRSLLFADWALHTDRPTILCDVDLLWNNDSITDLMQDTFRDQVYSTTPDITLFRREGFGVQPFNGGLILTQPGRYAFWYTFREMMRTLPNDIKHWWGDQIALGVMLGMPEQGQNGIRKFNSVVAYLPVDLVAPAPKVKPTEPLKTSAVHFKGGGKRKPWYPDYFDMLHRSWSAQQAAE